MEQPASRTSRARLFVPAALGAIALNLGAWVWVDARQARAAERPLGAAVPLGIRGVLPTLDVEGADRLTVLLDAPLVPPGAPLPEVVDAPFVFDGDLAGRWRVAARDVLEFELPAPLGFGRTVVARPTDALERLAGRAVAPGVSATWTTAPVALARLALDTFDPPTGVGVALLRLNAPRSVEELRETLLFAGCEKPEVLGEGTATEHRVRFRATITPTRQVMFRLSDGGDEQKWLSLSLPQRLGVVDVDCSTASSWDGGTLTLRFSATLDAAQAPPAVAVAPRVDDLRVRVQRNMLVVEGRFQAGETYVVTVPENVLATNGETLTREARLTAAFPARYPSLSLRYHRGVLGLHGHLGLELTSVAVTRVRVNIDELLPGNVVSHLRGDRRAYTSHREFSRVYDLAIDPAQGPVQQHVLDLAGLLAETPNGVRGTYAIEVEDVENGWVDDSALVRVTDLATTLKRDVDGVHAWVASLSTGQLVEGARVVLMTVTDQAIGEATTGADGYAFVGLGTSARASEPYVALVETADDATHQSLQGSRWSVPRAVAAGRAAALGTDVYVYPERSIYRPGDDVHLTGIVRSARGVVDPGARLSIEVERPDGQLAHAEDVTLDLEQALFHAHFRAPADARTGLWQVRVVDAATEKTVGRTRFSVEAFLPQRLAAEAATVVGDDAPVSTLSVRSLAGTSVAGFAAAVEATWTPRTYRSAAFPSFAFLPAAWVDGAACESTKGEAEAEVDAEGTASATLTKPEDAGRGLWSVGAKWSVSEPGGRSVVARALAVAFDDATAHVGVRVAVPDVDGAPAADAPPLRPENDPIVVSAHRPFEIAVVAVDGKDAPLDLESASVVVESVEVEWSLERSRGDFVWVRKEQVEVVWSGTCAVEDGIGRSTLALDSTGRHRVTVRSSEDTAPIGLEFWATDGDVDTFQVPSDGDVTVTLHPGATRVTPGESLLVGIEAPFDGEALLVLEDERVRWHGRATVVDGVASFAVEVPADVRGGVALSCQVTRPVVRGLRSWVPHRAYGWARVETDHSTAALAPRIDAPARVRPGVSAHVEVVADAPAGARVHLWAVDEGIRLAGGHVLPDPFEHYYGPRSRGVASTDAWFELLPDLDLPAAFARIGGDADGAREARHRAPERVHREPGVVWLDAVPLEGGVARFDVETPGFTGELTWMAVVVANERYGSAQAATTLAAELPVEATFPRFAAPGDVALVPVRVENQSNAAAEFTLAVDVVGATVTANAERAALVPVEAALDLAAQGAGPLEFAPGERITLQPGERALAWLNVEFEDARRALGALRLEGTFADGRAIAERVAIDLPLRRGSPAASAARTLAFDANDTRGPIDVSALVGLDRIDRAMVHVSSDPGVRLLPVGHYLASYPHGCAEQTASRVLAYLLMPGLLAAGDDADFAEEEVRARVKFGLERLRWLQKSDGGVGYWSGDDASNPWATAWVAEVVARALELGQDVPDGLAEDLATYCARRVDQPSIPRMERVVAVLAAARIGRAPSGWLRRLEEESSELAPSERVMLAAALAVVGEPERALAQLAQEGGTEWVTPYQRHVASDVRIEALRLETLLRAAPGDERVHAAAQKLERRLDEGNGRFANTLANAAALDALARYRSAVQSVPATWAGRVGDFEVDRAGSTFVVANTRAPLAVELAGDGPVFVTVRADGHARADAPARTDGLELRRRLVDGDGNEVDLDEVRVGDLFFVDLTARATAGTVADCVLVDPLPAGFEVENPRLVLLETPDGIAGIRWPRLDGDDDDGEDDHVSAPLAAADRAEFLDDRVLLFGTLGKGSKRYRYAVRAVAVGTFEHAAAAVESMYEPEIGATTGPAGTLRVSRR